MTCCVLYRIVGARSANLSRQGKHVASGSERVVYAGIAANGFIAICKFAAALWTGSSAMLSEGVHSIVDTGNQSLLLYGIRRSRRPADAAHPFGYGPELYFWAFVVAIILFAAGAGVSIYEGIEKIRNPHPVEDVYINYIVLGVAGLFEGWACMVAYREFRRNRGDGGLMEELRHSKDPAVFTILFEDTAAILGLMVAATGLALAEWLQVPELDGAASIVIGLILAGAAAFLARETKGLLIGEAARPEVQEAIRAIVMGHAGIKAVNEMQTLHFGPEEVLLTLSIDFEDDLSSSDVEALISDMEADIKAAQPQITRIFIEAQSIAGHWGAAKA